MLLDFHWPVSARLDLIFGQLLVIEFIKSFGWTLNCRRSEEFELRASTVNGKLWQAFYNVSLCLFLHVVI
ncbi:hypothetical protein E2C01_054482 [Portunus trituberculatus]|uniref:Uncharacterized protein n=1 Tax=Portunus trituberculatus TaxID=210409 RepID=A0A5B7GTT5_PORTR|nr:hypothetical protein [Portunus trituberculatus]